MKDLLRDFTFKKILKHLSSECIDTLLISKAGFDSERIASIRKTKKTKTAILEAIAAEIHDNNECITEWHWFCSYLAVTYQILRRDISATPEDFVIFNNAVD